MPSQWYNSIDASDFRTFMADLIDEGLIEDLDDASTFLERPQRYNDLYKTWVDNGFEFPEGMEVEVSNETDG